MAAYLGGALKAYIESLGLSIQAFRDVPPKGTSLRNPQTGAATPYVTIGEDIALTVDGAEDGGTAYGDEGTGVEVVQVDLWQPWRDADDHVLESATLADNLMRKLHGSRLNASGTGVPAQHVYGVYVQNRLRVLERDQNLVHHAYTLRVHRVI